MALPSLLVNVANSWCFLPDGATCINSNIGHQVVPLALPLIQIALFTSLVGIELLSSSTRVTSVKSAKGGSATQLERSDQGNLVKMVNENVKEMRMGKNISTNSDQTGQTQQNRRGQDDK